MRKKEQKDIKTYRFSVFESKASGKEQQPLRGDLVAGYGRISTTMSKNLSAPQQLNIFDAMPPEERALYISVVNQPQPRDTAYTDRQGKLVYLTNSQSRLLYALSYFGTLPDEMAEEDISKYTKALNRLNAEGKMPQANKVSRVINIQQLAKFLFGRTAIDYVRKTGEMLEQIADIWQIVDYPVTNAEGKSANLRTSCKLFHIDEKVELLPSEIESSGKGRKRSEADSKKILLRAKVVYGSAFFHRIDRDFAYITPKLFELWGKKGNGSETELFSNLLSDLCSKYRGHYLAAKKAAAQAKKDGLSKDDAAAAVNSALCYSELSSTLKSRITTDYSSTRMQKIRYYDDLNKAIEVLKEYGIITGASVANKGIPSKEKIVFYFSLDFQQFAKDDEQELGVPEDTNDTQLGLDF